MERYKSPDTWVEREDNKENYIASKTVDSTIFVEGTIIPQRYHRAFENLLSTNFEIGKKISINFIINEIKFTEIIEYYASATHGMKIKFIFSKRLRQYLAKEFSVSNSYIINEKNKGIRNSKVPEELKEYMDFYSTDEKDTFLVKLIKRDKSEEETKGLEEEWNNANIIKNYNTKETIDFIYDYITSLGYTYDKSLIKNIYLCLKTKPFLILSGISGTGKSKIIELFARALGATAENKRFNLVPVKPDWSDSTDLLGYRNIEGKFTPGVITKMCYDAMINKDVPYFIILDEMNLARVEYYFSDILSLMETRRLNEEGEIVTNKLLNKDMLEYTDNGAFVDYWDVYIPENVYIIGTVNMDETTFSFSRKVLDRANTIEFNKVELSYDFDRIFTETEEPRILHNDFLKSRFLKIKDCSEYKEVAVKTINKLIRINTVLEKYNFHFAYRVRDEIVFYMIYSIDEKILSFDEAIDNCIVQKVLSKINGSSNECDEALRELLKLLSEDGGFRNSSKKLISMIRRYDKDGFTSFW